MKKETKIAIVGAGVVGLSTALCLQKEFPLADITIIADKVCDDTLSAGAGGLYRPEISIDPNLNRLMYVFKSFKYRQILCCSGNFSENITDGQFHGIGHKK